MRLNAAKFGSVRPDHGGRLEFKLGESSEASACYGLSIFTADGEFSADPVVTAEGGVIRIGEWRGGTPPEWLSTLAHALLRGIWRTHQSDGAWPRRVTRWRPEPES